jgi:hypothetical protein
VGLGKAVAHHALTRAGPVRQPVSTVLCRVLRVRRRGSNARIPLLHTQLTELERRNSLGAHEPCRAHRERERLLASSRALHTPCERSAAGAAGPVRRHQRSCTERARMHQGSGGGRVQQSPGHVQRTLVSAHVPAGSTADCRERVAARECACRGKGGGTSAVTIPPSHATGTFCFEMLPSGSTASGVPHSCRTNKPHDPSHRRRSATARQEHANPNRQEPKREPKNEKQKTEAETADTCA